MKYRIIIGFSLFIGVFACINVGSLKQEKFNGSAQGTYYTVTYYNKDGRNLQSEIDTLSKDFNLIASMWLGNSLISKVNKNETGVVMDEIFKTLFDKSKKVY